MVSFIHPTCVSESFPPRQPLLQLLYDFLAPRIPLPSQMIVSRSVKARRNPTHVHIHVGQRLGRLWSEEGLLGMRIRTSGCGRCRMLSEWGGRANWWRGHGCGCGCGRRFRRRRFGCVNLLRCGWRRGHPRSGENRPFLPLRFEDTLFNVNKH